MCAGAMQRCGNTESVTLLVAGRPVSQNPVFSFCVPMQNFKFLTCQHWSKVPFLELNFSTARDGGVKYDIL